MTYRMPSIALYQFIKVTKLMHSSKMAKNRKFRKKKGIKRHVKDKIKSWSCHLKSKTLKQSQTSKKLKDLANMNKKFIINLANENLNDAEIFVSGRGLKFIDVPKDPKAYICWTGIQKHSWEKCASVINLWPTKKENESIVLNLHLVGTLFLHLV